MLFVVDASRDVGQEILDKMKKSIEEQLTIYNVSSVGTRVSILAYGSKPEALIGLRDGTTPAAVTTALEKLKKISGKRRLDVALQTARNDVLSKRGGARDNVGKLIVVFLAGANDPAGSTGLGSERKALEDSGIKVSVVGVGPNAKEKDVDAVASDSSTVSRIESADHLNEATSVISESAGRAAGNFLLLYVACK